MKTGQSIALHAFTDDDGRSYPYFGSGSTGDVSELNGDVISFCVDRLVFHADGSVAPVKPVL